MRAYTNSLPLHSNNLAIKEQAIHEKRVFSTKQDSEKSHVYQPISANEEEESANIETKGMLNEALPRYISKCRQAN